MFTAPFLQVGVFYDIIAPPLVTVGQNFWLTIVVRDQGGGTKTDYCGTTAFTSSDPSARVEGAAMASYLFDWSSSTACADGDDQDGVRMFMQVRFSELGLQSIVATDAYDGSIIGLSTIMVVGADVKLTKEPRVLLGASGDAVGFRVCWSNYSSASALQFVITDAIPQGTTYVPEALSDSLCSFTPGNPVSLVPAGQAAYSVDTSGTMPPAGSFITTGGSPPDTARWLRWTLGEVGVRTSGCVCYKVRID